MRSPFAGMDPYLEDPLLWSGFQATLLGIFRELLNPQVRPAYWVDIEERLYVDVVDDKERVIQPDAILSRARAEERSVAPAASSLAAPTAVLEVAMMGPFREPRVAILRRGTREVVAIIEVLSPTNKRSEGNGRSAYLAKRTEVLSSTAHLVEIDLLRGGRRVPMKRDLPACDYVALVHRRQKRPWADVFAMSLRERLPTLPVPLGEGDPDAALDLHRAVDLTYERGAYDVELDYRQEPEPRLSDDAAAWAHSLLRDAGLRPA